MSEGADTDPGEVSEGADSYSEADADSYAEMEFAPAPRSPMRAALIVAALVLVAFIIGRATAPDDGSSGGDDATATTDATTPATGAPSTGLPFPSGDVNRTNYWGFANLQPVVIDTFHRSDADSLGVAGTDQAWVPVAGDWGIRDSAASQLPSSSPDASLAVVDYEGSGDGLTEVTMTVLEEGAGLVFRYRDPENYWSVTANPGVGTWTVTRVIRGEAEAVGEIPGTTVNGVTVSVVQHGASLRFLLDGAQYLAVTDDALANQLDGGLIAPSGSSGEARWNRFMIMRFGQTSPTETTVPEG